MTVKVVFTAMAFSPMLGFATHKQTEKIDIDVFSSLSKEAFRLLKALHMAAITEVMLREANDIPIVAIPSDIPAEDRDAVIVLLLLKTMDILPGY